MNEKDVLSLLKSVVDGTLSKEDKCEVCCLYLEELSKTEISYLTQHAAEYFKLCKKFPLDYLEYLKKFDTSVVKNILLSILDYTDTFCIEHQLYDNSNIIKFFKKIIEENEEEKDKYIDILDILVDLYRPFYRKEVNDIIYQNIGKKPFPCSLSPLEEFNKSFLDFTIDFINDYYNYDKYDTDLKQWFETKLKKPTKFWDEKYATLVLKNPKDAISFLYTLKSKYKDNPSSLDNNILKVLENFFEKIDKKDKKLGMEMSIIISLFSSDKYIDTQREKLSYYLQIYKKLLEEKYEKAHENILIYKKLKKTLFKEKITSSYLYLKISLKLRPILHALFPFIFPSPEEYAINTLTEALPILTDAVNLELYADDVTEIQEAIELLEKRLNINT